MKNLLQHTRLVALASAIALSGLAACTTVAPSESAAQKPASEIGQTIGADATTIAYETHGAGELALVFIHGWSCDRAYWREQLPHFAEDYKVVAIDLAGHGASGDERESYSMENFGADVAAVVDHLGLERVVLIGHSMGGLVIVDGGGQNRRARCKRDWHRYAESGRRAPPVGRSECGSCRRDASRFLGHNGKLR